MKDLLSAPLKRSPIPTSACAAVSSATQLPPDPVAATANINKFQSHFATRAVCPATLHNLNCIVANATGNNMYDRKAANSRIPPAVRFLAVGAAVANDCLETTNPHMQGRAIPGAVFSKTTGPFSIADVLTPSPADTAYDTLFSPGQSTCEYLLAHRSRRHNQKLTQELFNGTMQSGTTVLMERKWKGDAPMAAHPAVGVMAFDFTNDTLSYNVNGVLQGRAFGAGGQNLEELAGMQPQNNSVGGFEAFGNQPSAVTTPDFPRSGAALIAGQGLFDYQMSGPMEVSVRASALLMPAAVIGPVPAQSRPADLRAIGNVSVAFNTTMGFNFGSPLPVSRLL